MKKLTIVLMMVMLITGCSPQKIESDHRALVAVIAGLELSTPGTDPTPEPSPSSKHKRADCPVDGWVVHGDGHKTPCPDCIDEGILPELAFEPEAVELEPSVDPMPKGDMAPMPEKAMPATEDCPDGVCPIPKPRKEEVPNVSFPVLKEKVILPPTVAPVETIVSEGSSSPRVLSPPPAAEPVRVKSPAVLAGERYYALRAERKAAIAAKAEEQRVAATEKLMQDPPPAAKPAKEIYTEHNGYLWLWKGDKWDRLGRVEGSCSSGSCSSGSCSSGGCSSGGCSSCQSRRGAGFF